MGLALNEVLFINCSIYSPSQCLDSDITSFCYVLSSQLDLWNNADLFKIGRLRSHSDLRPYWIWSFCDYILYNVLEYHGLMRVKQQTIRMPVLLLDQFCNTEREYNVHIR